MKRYFTGGLALLLALNLALPGSTVTLAEDMATSSDMDASMHGDSYRHAHGNGNCRSYGGGYRSAHGDSHA